MRVRAALAILALGVMASSVAQADPAPSVNLRNFHPPADPRGSLFLEPSATPGAGAWNVGAIASYAHRLVSLEDAAGSRVAIPVEHQLSLDYVASLGIGDRLALSIGLPSVLYQTGDDTDALLGGGTLPRTAIGDVGFGAKATLVPTSSLGGFGLAALGRVSAPTGDRRSYVSDGSITGELRLLGELKLIALALQATAGARIRGEEQTYVGQDFGHDLPWGVGVAVRPQAFGLDHEGRFTWTAEVRGQVALTPSFGAGPQSPALFGLSSRYTVGDVSLLGGLELPMNSAVGSPLVRGVLGLGWAPRFYDEDGDGIADDVDQCPELPEDRDGFEDADGCPDFDNDDDGIPDDVDRCPNEPEDEDGFEDADGCPDPDNDGDGVLDKDDKCPNEAGPATGSGRGPGCPVTDSDGDGVLDGVDRCPNEPEDKDGFEDEDGCPDPDNDGDGIPDDEDACPNAAGPERSDPNLHGCPSPDRDGDTFTDAVDKCPDEAEDFDGVEDEDGCPDPDDDKPPAQRAKLLVDFERKGADIVLRFRVSPRLVGDQLDPKTLPSVRALAQLLNRNPTWVALVGVRPGAGANAEQAALTRSFVLVHKLRELTYRDEAAESVGWAAVKDQPDANKLGYGILILGPPQPTKGRLKLPTRAQPGGTP
ncbi:MAG: thrombospondin type 3 repeat-containing protein [Polyangiaceae bacterium]|nr:thrombospondin type 3 repeat-containing protein [Polyangiaceae bacterium]